MIPYSPCIGDCTKCPAKHRAIVYGPVQSRRRGRSLGINPFPRFKVCSFDCVYCLRGRTILKICEPEKAPVQVNPEEIINILRNVLDKVETDTIDLSGNGEPTLYPYLEELCIEIRKICRDYSIKSFGIFTNSTTLTHRRVLKALENIDHIEAKLDTAIEHKFKMINRPLDCISIRSIVEGLKNVKRIGSELAIQILLLNYRDNNVEVRNYTEEDAKELSKVLSTVDPDVVNIYTVYRPIESKMNIFPVTYEDIKYFVNKLKSNGFKVRVFLH